MAFAPGFSSLAVLGAAVQRGSDDEAQAAVESADAIAARKHAQTDIEEADELASGCQALLAAAKDPTRPGLCVSAPCAPSACSLTATERAA